MDWNLKIPCWDFTEFEQGTIPNIDLSKGNFSVDLKLGQVIDESSVLKTTTSKMALSPSGSSKRARPINNNNNNSNNNNTTISSSSSAVSSCLVDGCNSDLTNCKEYHRRHKVCEVHSKTPQVSINGQKQRFCQQCSRFHSLEEFDEGKRSCRKRLDGHNRRRRKPQPDTSRAATLFAGHQGTTMLQFSSPHVYQTTTLMNPMWAGMVKSEEDPTTYSAHHHSNLTHKHNSFPEPSSGSGTKKLTDKQQQFSLFQNSGSHLKLNHQTSPPKGCQQQPVLNFEPTSSYDKLFCDGYPPPARLQPVVQSDCALSLLSSSPSQTSCTTLSHVVHPPNSNSFTATPNPLDPGAGYGGLESIMDPNGNDCNEMIQMGLHHHHHNHHNHHHHHHASPDNEPPQTLPFYWE